MSDGRGFNELWHELQRIGVDAENFPAGLTLSGSDAIRILRAMPEQAGPAAFLAAIREEMGRTRPAEEGDSVVIP